MFVPENAYQLITHSSDPMSGTLLGIQNILLVELVILVLGWLVGFEFGKKIFNDRTAEVHYHRHAWNKNCWTLSKPGFLKLINLA